MHNLKDDNIIVWKGNVDLFVLFVVSRKCILEIFTNRSYHPAIGFEAVNIIYYQFCIFVCALSISVQKLTKFIICKFDNGFSLTFLFGYKIC